MNLKFFLNIILIFVFLGGCKGRQSKNPNSQKKDNKTTNNLNNKNSKLKKTPLKVVRRMSLPSEVPALFSKEINLQAEKLKKVSFGFAAPKKNWDVTFEKRTRKYNKLKKSKMYAVISTKGLKLLKNPGSKAKQMSSVTRGDIVRVIKNATKDELHPYNARIESSRYNYGVTVNGLWNNYVKVETIDGKTGWLFGAYLSQYSSLESALIQSAGYYRAMPMKDYQEGLNIPNQKWLVSSKMRKKIEKDRVLFQYVSPHNIHLSLQEPDDMYLLYNRLPKTVPIAVTTDFVLHIFHKIYDEYLIELEKKEFIPKLKLFEKSLLEAIKKEGNKNHNSDVSKSLKLLEGYVCVAAKLLDISPVCSSDVQNLVKQDVSKINSASITGMASTTGFIMDFTQFIPRGHYTLSKELKNYFKSMMWMGKMRFLLERKSKPNRISIFLLSKIILENKELLSSWSDIYDPITLLVGAGDDLTIRGVNKLVGLKLNKLSVEDLGKTQITKSLASEISNKMKKQKIKGDIFGEGLCLFSQRFVIDGLFYTLLSHSAVNKRYMVKVLDTATALGSKRAESLVKSEYKKYSSYGKQMTKCKKVVKAMGIERWLANIYQAVIGATRNLLQFPEKTGFPWLDNAKYTNKNLLAFHGIYAELKRDTILYAKQAGSNSGSARPFRKYQYKQDPLPTPPGWVEPNVPFFKWMQAASALMIKTVKVHDKSFERTVKKLKIYHDMVKKLGEIAQKFASYKPLSKQDYKYIQNEFRWNAHTILRPHTGNSVTREQLENAKMPVVADIYTDGTNGKVLEVAVGFPYRIYMAVESPAGGKRIVVGYTYSYYEFSNSSSGRMTDQEWRKKVYSQKDTPSKLLTKMQPQWERFLFK